jgi:hypothetical protein
MCAQEGATEAKGTAETAPSWREDGPDGEDGSLGGLNGPGELSEKEANVRP